MKISLAKRLIVAALCALFATLIFFTQHLVWSFESNERDCARISNARR